jgi:hypothetical protein
MKKIFKIFGIIMAVILALILILYGIARFKEKEIADIALRKLGRSIKAPLAIDDIHLSLIRRFPLATIELHGLWMGTPDAYGVSDSLITADETLARIDRVFISVKSRPLFRGEFEIMMVEIRSVDFAYIVDKQGISNIDFLMSTTPADTTDTTSVSLDVVLKELSLEDIRCRYYDSLQMVKASLLIPEAEISGEIKGDYLQGAARGEIILSDCSYQDTRLYLMDQTEIEFGAKYAGDSVFIDELNLITDGAKIDVSGMAIVGDSIDMDLLIHDAEIDLGEVIKYVPRETLRELGLKKAKGVFDLTGSVIGIYADSVLPEVNAEFTMKEGFIAMTDYPSLSNISFIGSLTNGKLRNNQTTAIQIENFHAQTEKSTVDMVLSMKDLEHIQYDLKTDIILDLSEIKSFLPDSLVEDVKGQVVARLATHGVLPDSIGSEYVDYLMKNSKLDLQLNDLTAILDSSLTLESLSGKLIYDFYHFTARDLQVKIPVYSLNLHNSSFDVQLTGKISNLAQLGIGLNSLQIRTDSSVIYGSGRILNPEAPTYSFSSNMKLNLGEFKAFLPDSMVNSITGGLEVQITSGGKLDLDSISEQMMDLVFEKSAFRFSFDRISVDMADTLMNVDDLSGAMTMSKDIIELKQVQGKYHGIDFSMDSTRIRNLYSAIMLNQPIKLYVDTRIALGELDYTFFAPFIEGDEDSTLLASEKSMEAEVTEEEPSNYTYAIKGKFRIKSFTYDKAIFDDISALFNITDSLYLVDQFKFKAFQGLHNTSVRYSIQKNEEQNIWIKNNAKGLDVNQLLKDFDNFKAYYEPSISYENISGILSSRLDAQVLFRNDTLVEEKLYVRGNVKLEKGGVYNYPPVQDMAQYIPGIDNLDRLEFKTINCDLFVFQEAVYVPTTLIVSNKLDASALGMQSFGEDYSYHFIVFLSDLLTGKSKKRIEKQDAQGEEVTSAGRKGTMVKSYSIDGKSRSGLDNENDRKTMERKVKASEAQLNLRFHPNLVHYDTGVE